MNMLHKNTIPIYLLILSSFILNACSSTKLTEEWHDAEYTGPALKKILIVGVIKSKSRRYSFEDEFAKLITNDKREGIASYTMMPNLTEYGHKKHILNTIKKLGADGVLIVTTHGVYQQNRTTVPSLDYVPGASMGYSYGMYGYYDASHSYVFNQGYTVSDTILRVDTKLFSAATKKVIWSAKTKTVNPNSAEEVIAEYEKLVIGDMQRHGVIK